MATNNYGVGLLEETNASLEWMDAVVAKEAVPINYQLAEVILDSLRAAGFPCGIIGGYARDRFFGLTPKDMDICVAVGSQDDDGAIESINERISNIMFEGCYKNKIYVARHSFGMYNDHASDRACGVFKYPEDGIDVILYRDCNTVPDIVNSFDFNLNQFGMDGEHDDIPVYAGTSDLRTLKAIRGDHNETRGLYVLNKHRNLLPEIERSYKEGRLV